MARKNSKNKGNRAERKLADAWQEWSGKEFGRVPASGGLRWKRTSDTVSDIICTDKKHYIKFPFAIESKFYQEISINELLLPRKSKIDDFWAQAKGDAIRGNKLPLLFFRYNRMPANTWFVAIPVNLLRRLRYKGPYLKYGMEFYLIFSTDFFSMVYKVVVKAGKAILKQAKENEKNKN